jgi:hypothetical protein
MIIPNDDLRTLCIENDWFTCGSIRQYERLFEANRFGADVDEIALIIWICSDEVPKYKIREILMKAQKEYDDAMEKAEAEMEAYIANGERAADEVYCGYYD